MQGVRSRSSASLKILPPSDAAPPSFFANRRPTRNLSSTFAAHRTVLRPACCWCPHLLPDLTPSHGLHLQRDATPSGMVTLPSVDLRLHDRRRMQPWNDDHTSSPRRSRMQCSEC